MGGFFDNILGTLNPGIIVKGSQQKPWDFGKFSLFFWLVVSTHLKNISQIGNRPQIGVKIKKGLKPPPSFSGQVEWIIFHQPGFPEKGGISLKSASFWWKSVVWRRYTLTRVSGSFLNGILLRISYQWLCPEIFRKKVQKLNILGNHPPTNKKLNFMTFCLSEKCQLKNGSIWEGPEVLAQTILVNISWRCKSEDKVPQLQ